MCDGSGSWPISMLATELCARLHCGPDERCGRPCEDAGRRKLPAATVSALLSLWAAPHFVAIFFQIFRQVLRTNPALPVAGYRIVDKFWVRQI